ncbi:hypothetical protein [Endozoicomonas montiporae]|nr:hypothetical protein [Endozoicomonas montiporae]AMO56576.1 replication protein O [Endozoicomonas montiporae CL-33]
MTNVVAYRPEFREVSGSAAAAVMLSQFFYWSQNKTTRQRNGWFYKTAKQITEETGLTRSEQETARRRLIAAGLMQEKLCGVPAKVWFCLDLHTLASQLKRIGSALADTLLEVTRPIAKVSKKTAMKAVDMVKEFTGQQDAKPMATFVDHKAPFIQFSADDFAECNMMIRNYIGHIEQCATNNKKPELVRLFRRFGLNSHYVQKCFTNHLKQFISWFDKAKDSLEPWKKELLMADYKGLTEEAWEQAKNVTPATINA